MHVCCGELECVVHAVGFDWAVAAEGSCVWDVGDVFVVFGEHGVGLPFAVRFVSPFDGFVVVCGLGCVYCALWGVVKVLCRDSFEGVHWLSVECPYGEDHASGDGDGVSACGVVHEGDDGEPFGVVCDEVAD